MRFLLSFTVMTALSACVSFSDLRATYPDLGHPVYHVVTVDSLQPTLRWEASTKATEGYDLVVYEGPETFFAYMEGGEHRIVYTRDGIRKTEHGLEEPLQPDRYYLVHQGAYAGWKSRVVAIHLHRRTAGASVRMVDQWAAVSFQDACCCDCDALIGVGTGQEGVKGQHHENVDPKFDSRRIRSPGSTAVQ